MNAKPNPSVELTRSGMAPPTSGSMQNFALYARPIKSIQSTIDARITGTKT
jgi:hypothetical protein